MNITQQVAASIGTALFSVLLTNAYNAPRGHGRDADAAPSRARADRPTARAVAPTRCRPSPRLGLHYMGEAFGDVFLVATVLVGLCLVPAFFLPRKPQPAVAACRCHDGRLTGAVTGISCACVTPRPDRRRAASAVLGVGAGRGRGGARCTMGEHGPRTRSTSAWPWSTSRAPATTCW